MASPIINLIEENVKSSMKERNKERTLTLRLAISEFKKEEKEISILQDFLPEQLGEEEIRELVTEAISATEASEPADIGKVMGALKSKIKGNADMGLVSRIVKENLA